ncbi:MAG: hypothetical protein JNJ47_07220, partial [Alphaproteobacteria bacterium]|nr:hypothetical protein [Alphaproteobacteria bacterium]
MNNLKLIVLSILVILTFTCPQTTYAMDEILKYETRKSSPGIQLKKVTDDELESVLGTGNDVLLKMRMSLKALKTPIGKEQMEVPVQLFLTDFVSSPINHPAIDLNIKVDCESTSPTCVLPHKPASFDSYAQFADWLSQGYFTNQLKVTYNFHLDIHKSAPSLVEHLFSVLPEGYHFIGTHVLDNVIIKSTQCVPQVTYSSKRGNTNETTASLGGIFYLDSYVYSIDDHYQIFPHQMIEKIVCKRDKTKKFYSHKWLAQSEVTTKATYEEFPKHQIQNWPGAPSESYSLLQQKPGDLEEIEHLACWDGISGEDVDISDGKVFLIDCDVTNKKEAQFLESIVKDTDGKLYTIHYQYSEKELNRRQLENVQKHAEEEC